MPIEHCRVLCAVEVAARCWARNVGVDVRVGLAAAERNVDRAQTVLRLLEPIRKGGGRRQLRDAVTGCAVESAELNTVGVRLLDVGVRKAGLRRRRTRRCAVAGPGSVLAVFRAADLLTAARIVRRSERCVTSVHRAPRTRRTVPAG